MAWPGPEIQEDEVAAFGGATTLREVHDHREGPHKDCLINLGKIKKKAKDR